MIRTPAARFSFDALRMRRPAIVDEATMSGTTSNATAVSRGFSCTMMIRIPVAVSSAWTGLKSSASTTVFTDQLSVSTRAIESPTDVRL